jgi:hypothetical protein
VCQDRTNLQDHDLAPVSFAYPFGSVDDAAAAAVRSCGYASARGVGGTTYRETVPPRDPYRLRTPALPRASTRLAGYQKMVRVAERRGGGWVILVFHGICDNQCTGTSSTTPAQFEALLDWLQERRTRGTRVRTVGAVIARGPTPPRTAISCNGSSCTRGWYRHSPVPVRLSATDPNGVAATTYYTTDGSDPRGSGDRRAYVGRFAVSRTTTVRYYSTDRTGQAEPPRSRRIRVDAARPRVSLTTPTAGTTYRRGGKVLLGARALDRATGPKPASGIGTVVFRDGRRTLATVTTPVSGTTTYRFSWRPGSVSTGWHSLTARATDVAGNTTTSSTVRVYLRR